MDYPILEFEKDIIKKLSNILETDDISLEIPSEERGDYALPCFSFASKLKKNPVEIASWLADELRLEMGEIKQTGPYLNFHIDHEYLIRGTLETCFEMGRSYGTLEPTGKKMLIEHTSANPNGPLHVGRARNPIIGDTIARIFQRAGYQVEAQFYVDDIGRQVAILSWGLLNIEEKDIDEGKSNKIDHKMVGYYQLANELMERDKEVKDGISELMKAIEKGDQETINLFADNSNKVLEGMKESLERLNISHDSYKSESSLIKDGSVEKTANEMEKLDQCHREENALFYEKGDNRMFLTRGDGTNLYPLRDIAYHIWKANQADELIDVLGEDHKVHGVMIKDALENLGIDPVPEIIFHSFVSFGGERMSTRKGAYVTLDDMMDLAHEKAVEEVLQRRDDLDVEQVEKIAETVGMGAVRYNIIRVQPEKPMDFRWEEALNFQGNSAPFIQYAHARAASILRRWGGKEEELGSTIDFSRLNEPGEIQMIKKMAQFPREIRQAAISKAPHLMANYAYELAAQFNQFYRDHPVINSEDKREERLAIVAVAKIVLGNVLETLGIDSPELM